MCFDNTVGTQSPPAPSVGPFAHESGLFKRHGKRVWSLGKGTAQEERFWNSGLRDSGMTRPLGETKPLFCKKIKSQHSAVGKKCRLSSQRPRDEPQSLLAMWPRTCYRNFPSLYSLNHKMMILNSNELWQEMKSYIKNTLHSTYAQSIFSNQSRPLREPRC